MKAHPCLLSGLAGLLIGTSVLSPSALAQDPSTPSATAAMSVTPLEELVAPIALYPDALVALILPASTTSSDVVLAARFLGAGGNAAQIEGQPWEDSVKGLAHYPEVVKWMDENLSWMQRLGEAYLQQPEAVMAAIQRARTQARANGVLIDTPQQQVVVDGGYIRIIPAEPNVIYVPRYDPEIIYIERPIYHYPDPWITFGLGFGVGSWLAYDLDWHRSIIWRDHRRHDRWHEYRDWRHRSLPGRPGYIARDRSWSPWHPVPGRPRPPHRDHDRWTRDSIRPAPLPGAPRFDRDRWKDHANRSGDGDRSRNDRRRQEGDSRISPPRPSDGQGRRPGAGSNFSGADRSPRVEEPSRAVAPPSTDRQRDQPRQAGERRERQRQPGAVQVPERRSDGGGSFSTVPSNRRPPPATSDSTRIRGDDNRTRSNGERLRDRMPGERSSNQANRPEPARMRSTPSVVTPSAPAIAAAPPQVARPIPQQRDFRQPDRIARPATPPPERVSAPEPARTQAPAAQNHGDRGHRPSVSDRGQGEGRGRGGEGRGRGDRNP